MEQTVRRVAAPTGEEIAYATVGSGPLLILAAWWVSHLEVDWNDPRLREFMETLGQRHTVVRYDRPGVGLSDRSRRRYDLDGETMYLRTVAEAAAADAGQDRFDLLGISCGGPAAVRLSSESPERVGRLVLFASYLTGEDITDPATRSALTDLVRANWGMGSSTLTNIMLPDAEPDAARRFNRSQRRIASPDVAADLLDLTFQLDSRPHVGDVATPTLVLHRAHDQVITAQHGRRLADAIDGAEYCELEGKVHVPWTSNCSAALGHIERFLTGQTALAPPQRRLATVAMIDIVGSTDILSEIGDARWRERLDALATIVDEEAELRGGTVHKDTGDGALASFDLPVDAFDWAIVVRSRARGLGLPLRTGIHMGEVEMRGDDITGLSVVVASRVADRADADQIFATAATAELAAGAGLVAVGAGTHDLKGIAGEKTLVEVAPTDRGAGSAPRSEAAGESATSRSTAGSTTRFGEFELDPIAFELRRDGIPVDVEPQVFEVLHYLVQRAGELVSKEQLLDDVWGDRFVSESSLSSRIRSARVAIGDDGQRQSLIKTVHGRGFRFVGEITP